MRPFSLLAAVLAMLSLLVAGEAWADTEPRPFALVADIPLLGLLIGFFLLTFGFIRLCEEV